MNNLDQILNSSSKLVAFALDTQYRYLFFNKNHAAIMRQIWGIDIAEGHSMLEYITLPEDSQKAKRNFDKALAGEEFTLTEEYGDEALDRLFYENAYSPLRDDSGEVTGLVVFVTDITERKQDMLRIEGNEQLLQSINTNIQEGIYRATDSRGLVYVNSAFARMFGYTKEELLGTVTTRLFADANFRDDLIDVLRTEGTVSNYEVLYRRKDGSTFWGLLSARIAHGADGSEYFDGAIRDIDKQKEAEQKHRENRQLLESINQNISEGIYRSDESGLIYVNQALIRIFGYGSEAELLDVPSAKLYKDPAERARLVEVLKLYGLYENEEVIFLRKDHSEFIGLISSRSYTDENGKMFWDGAVRDVTAERQQMRKIRENEQLLQSINHNINEAIYRSEFGRGIVYVNDAFVKMFGYTTADEVITGNAIDLYKNPEDRETLGDLLVKDGAVTNFEVLFKRRDGSSFWGSLSSITIKNEDGRVFFDGAIRDITQQKETAEALRLQNGRLRDFSYITSHNIRSSVANLLGLLEIRKMDPGNKEIDGMLHSTAHRLNETLNNINELLNFENELEGMKPTSCNLLKAIQHAIDLNRQDIVEQGLDIHLEVEPTVTVKGFAAYLDSIFHNLITNAIKYGTTDASKRIDIVAKPKNGGYLIEVIDHGLGIDMKRYGDRLFKLGSRFHAEKGDGQGLGLFMTKRQIDAMGGTIEVESKENLGTTFKIWLHE